MSASSSGPPEPLPTSVPSGGDHDDRVRVQQLYRENWSSLVRQLTRRTGCRELARELANETFLRLLRMAPGKVCGIEQPDAYLRRASINLLREWGRAAAPRHRLPTDAELPSDGQFDQIAALEARDTLRGLEKVIGKLKPRTREIFLAQRIQGFTYAEIAERTGLSAKGVEKQMSKAIARIDRFLGRY